MSDAHRTTTLVAPEVAYVLPEDVRIVPVAAYADQVGRRLELDPGHSIVVRDGARTPAKVIDPSAVALLDRFRTRTTVPDAIRAYALGTGADPAAVLSGAFPLLRAAVADGILVAADSGDAEALCPTVAVGARIGRWTVERCVHLAVDSEVYEVRDGDVRGALKIARATSGRLAERIDAEAAVLRRLDGSSAPRLLDHGNLDDGGLDDGGFDDRRYLVGEWCAGLPLWVAAAPWRGDVSVGLDRLFELALGVVDAYAELHDHGVLHGDVHPDNVLVGTHGRIVVIDFGQAALPGPDGATTVVAGSGLTIDFCAPETAAAAAERRPLPVPTPAAEVYCIAALVHHLLAGTGHLDLPVELTAALRRIRTGPARSLQDCGVRVPPAVQRCLDRALATDPARRPQSVRRLADELTRALRTPEPSSVTSADPGRADLAWADDVFRPLRTFGPAPEPAGQPTPAGTSVAHGASGVALTLLRLATLQDDPELLAQADSWSAHAVRRLDDGSVPGPVAMPFPPAVAAGSLFYGATGTLVVRALVSRALADEESELEAVTDLLARIRRSPQETTELMFGSSGQLLGLGLLLEAIDGDPGRAEVRSEIRRAGASVLAQIEDRLDTRSPVTDQTAADDRAGYLGIAHGWAGPLLAAVRWSSVSGDDPSDRVRRRLDELVDLGQPSGAGVRWPVHASGRRGPFRSGWCNGSAGLVHLWLEAADLLQRPDLLALAERTAEDVRRSEPDGYGLCCGATGMAYALLAVHRRTGDGRWLAAARRLSGGESLRRPADPELGTSLYAGRLGPALLAYDLAQPDTATAPLFGRLRP